MNKGKNCGFFSFLLLRFFDNVRKSLEKSKLNGSFKSTKLMIIVYLDHLLSILYTSLTKKIKHILIKKNSHLAVVSIKIILPICNKLTSHANLCLIFWFTPKIKSCPVADSVNLPKGFSFFKFNLADHLNHKQHTYLHEFHLINIYYFIKENLKHLWRGTY